MASVVKRRWTSDIAAGLPRRDRRSCDYEAYAPDPLSGRIFRLDGSVAADVTDAERAIQRLELEGATLVDTEALARLLLRAEAVASSHIEGLEIGGRRLLRAEAARDLGVPSEDVTAGEVLGNIEAMGWAVSELAQADVVTADGILEVHRRLLRGTRLEAFGGVIRDTQNWIGGSSYNPCSAAFIPPPPEMVRDLLDDLASFCNTDELPPVAQAAIAHAQFETIHPFVDGNGRTGRALIHVIIRRRGSAPRVLPPVSLVLATWPRDYINGLTATRYFGDANSQEAERGVDEWIGTFAAACQRAVEDSLEFEGRIARLQAEWREALKPIRRNSAVDLLIGVLPGAPVFTVKGASRLVGRSFERTNEAVARLVEAEVVQPVTVGRRNRAFEARAIIDAFVDLERRLASPSGDTHSSPPTRPVPRTKGDSLL
ncbi:MAG: Fic family protein [Gemmatimonadota bacterium]